MQITVGKLLWIISFVAFILFSYNRNTVNRVMDIVTNEESKIVSVSEKVVSSSNMGEVLETEIDDIIENETDNILLIVEIEKLKWEMEQIEEKLVKMEIKITSLNENKNNMLNNILAILTTLTPFLVPIVTARYVKSHNKEIKMLTFSKKG